jgi:hypothetical protein
MIVATLYHDKGASDFTLDLRGETTEDAALIEAHAANVTSLTLFIREYGTVHVRVVDTKIGVNRQQ